MHDIKLERIESKIDKVNERLGSIDMTLAAQHVSLVEHIKRTALLETQIEPIKAHVAMMQGALKLLGLMAVMIGAAAAGIKVVQFILGI